MFLCFLFLIFFSVYGSEQQLVLNDNENKTSFEIALRTCPDPLKCFINKQLPLQDRLNLSLVSKKVKETVDDWRIHAIAYRIFWDNQERLFLDFKPRSEVSDFFEKNKDYITDGMFFDNYKNNIFKI